MIVAVVDTIVVVVDMEVVVGIETVAGNKAAVDHPHSTPWQRQTGGRRELSCLSLHRTVPHVMAILLERRFFSRHDREARMV